MNEISPIGYAPAADELVFLALGGAGEIGMNLSLYGYGGAWIMVDLGITFGNDMTPGVDVMVPNPEFIVDRRDSLLGIVLTHAHEDHLGAVPYLWRQLRVPVYATPFTAAILRRKLIEAGLENELPLTEIPPGGGIDLEPFRIRYIRVTHSIPEAHSLAIETPAGTVLHTADWKLDPDPLVGPVTDEAALRRLGEEGVIAMVCDSTNVFVEGETGSEAAVRESLTELVGQYSDRVAVTCFASNVARLESIAYAAKANGRHAALVGRSLWNYSEAARETGYLTDTDPFLTDHDAAFLPRDKVLLIITGSQGEPRSALSRIAAGDHREIVLEEGDVTIFSSRIIPGNEKPISRLQDRLALLGVDIVTERERFVHVSGHPARDDLRQLYEWVRPPVAVPVHGEERHLYEHARLARACKAEHAVIAKNGSVLRLWPGPPEIVDHVKVGRLAVDGNRLLPMDGRVIRTRQRMMSAGAAVATVVLNAKGGLAARPVLAVPGLLDGEADAVTNRAAVAAIVEAIEQLSDPARADDDRVAETARIAVRRSLHASLGKRPETRVNVVRV